MEYKYMGVIYKCDLCKMTDTNFPKATMYSDEGKHHICKNCFPNIMKLERKEI